MSKPRVDFSVQGKNLVAIVTTERWWRKPLITMYFQEPCRFDHLPPFGNHTEWYVVATGECVESDYLSWWLGSEYRRRQRLASFEEEVAKQRAGGK